MGKATNQKGLTDQQTLFAYKVVELGDASKAYRVAYPKSVNWKPESVWRMAHKLSKENIKVVSMIEQLRCDLMMKHELSVDQTIQELSRVAFMDIGEAFTDTSDLKKMDEMSAEMRRCVSSIVITVSHAGDKDNPIEIHTKKIKFHNKLTALEKLGQYLGMFTQKVDLNLTDSSGVIDKLTAGRVRIEQAGDQL